MTKQTIIVVIGALRFKTDTSSLTTTQHETAIFSIPWCIRKQAYTFTYIHTYEESDLAGTKGKNLAPIDCLPNSPQECNKHCSAYLTNHGQVILIDFPWRSKKMYLSSAPFIRCHEASCMSLMSKCILKHVSEEE